MDTSPTTEESSGGGVRQFHLLRQRTRHRPRVHSGEWERRISMEEGDIPSRDEAMMEGTRMLIENLREKILLLEEKIDRLDREKGILIFICYPRRLYLKLIHMAGPGEKANFIVFESRISHL